MLQPSHSRIHATAAVQILRTTSIQGPILILLPVLLVLLLLLLLLHYYYYYTCVITHLCQNWSATLYTSVANRNCTENKICNFVLSWLVGILHGESVSWHTALNCNPWDVCSPSQCEKASEAMPSAPCSMLVPTSSSCSPKPRSSRYIRIYTYTYVNTPYCAEPYSMSTLRGRDKPLHPYTSLHTCVRVPTRPSLVDTPPHVYSSGILGRCKDPAWDYPGAWVQVNALSDSD